MLEAVPQVLEQLLLFDQGVGVLPDAGSSVPKRVSVLATLRTAPARCAGQHVSRNTLPGSRQLNRRNWNHFNATTGRLSTRWHATAPGNPYTAQYNQTYDSAGSIYRADSYDNRGTQQLVNRTASYYDAAGRLRVHDRRSCLMATNNLCDFIRPDYNDRAAFEEYRYDALGRRILVRTRSPWFCAPTCRNAITRVLWDGDQVLYEISSPGRTGVPVDSIEQDTGQVTLQQYSNYAPYGRVLYTHGPGLDAPLGLVRMNYSNVFPEPILVLPLTNWQGQYDLGTIAGLKVPSTPPASGYCKNWPDPMNPPSYCMTIDWPAPYMWKTWYSRSRGTIGPMSWMGSLIEAGRDNSGQMYRRNRYYDPASGRFTQEDPIGLAGGLNLYGFANGDPVNFSDPFGLRVRLAHDPEGKIQRTLAALVGSSATFRQMFRALHLAPSSQADISVFACGLASSPASCGSLFLDRGGGAYRAWAPWNQRIDVNGTLSEEQLLDILTEEFVHAAIASRGKVKTGITCAQNEDSEACADRWLETIRQQRQEEDEAKKKENNQ